MFTFTMSDKGPNLLCDRSSCVRSFVRTRLRGPKFSDRHAKSIDARRASKIIGYASDKIAVSRVELPEITLQIDLLPGRSAGTIMTKQQQQTKSHQGGSGGDGSPLALPFPSASTAAPSLRLPATPVAARNSPAAVRDNDDGDNNSEVRTTAAAAAAAPAQSSPSSGDTRKGATDDGDDEHNADQDNETDVKATNVATLPDHTFTQRGLDIIELVGPAATGEATVFVEERRRNRRSAATQITSTFGRLAKQSSQKEKKGQKADGDGEASKKRTLPLNFTVNGKGGVLRVLTPVDKKKRGEHVKSPETVLSQSRNSDRAKECPLRDEYGAVLGSANTDGKDRVPGDAPKSVEHTRPADTQNRVEGREEMEACCQQTRRSSFAHMTIDLDVSLRKGQTFATVTNLLDCEAAGKSEAFGDDGALTKMASDNVKQNEVDYAGKGSKSDLGGDVIQGGPESTKKEYGDDPSVSLTKSSLLVALIGPTLRVKMSRVQKPLIRIQRSIK
jgi:hypothetical protein